LARIKIKIKRKIVRKIMIKARIEGSCGEAGRGAVLAWSSISTRVVRN